MSDLEDLRALVTDNPALPFGDHRQFKPCQWAMLHAGIEFIAPERDRLLLWGRSCGYSVDLLAAVANVPPVEVERAIGRASRTLATWERNASRWANRYVAREPVSAFPDGQRRGED
ncbi:MAG: hypothetical protein ACRD6W_15330 [Nitrososphaerales archaeon]